MLLNKFELFQIPLTPDNTLYFGSRDEQKTFFDTFENKVSLSDVTYNMGRSIRIIGDTLNFILFSGLNYGRFRYSQTDNYVYFFVKNYTYVNDNVCIVDFVIDFTQTFLLFELDTITRCKIGNITPKSSYFVKPIPYTNKFTPANFISEHIIDIGYKYSVNGVDKYFCFICVNFDGKVFTDINLYETLTEYGFDKNIYCGIFPIMYNASTRNFENIEVDLYWSRLDGDVFVSKIKTIDFSNVIKTLSPYIIDSSVAIITTPFDPLMRFSYSTAGNRLVVGENYYQIIELNGIKVLSPTQIGKSGAKVKQQFNYLNYFDKNNRGIYRNPYTYIRVGNDTNSIELNQYDFVNGMIDIGNLFEVEIRASLTFPYPVELEFYALGHSIIDRHKLFTLVTTENIPYSISKWDEYYATHKFSVDDGLATQQLYQTAQLRNDMKANQEKTNAEAVIGAVRWAGDRVTTSRDVIGNVVTGNFGGAISSANASTAKGINTAINIGESYWLLDIENRRLYNNLMTEQAKERAILALNWNDIKSSPDVHSNTTSTISSKYAKGWQGISIDFYYATNLEDIDRYHSTYGYRIDRYVNFNKNEYLNQHTVFDFISISDISFKSQLPHNVIECMKDVLNNGVRFWYKYETFLDYTVKNEER